MDIDIDFPTDFDPSTLFKQAVPAMIVKNDQPSKHPCGYYFQNIAVDQYSNLAAIPHREAEQLGYFKIDFLHLSILDSFQSKQQIRQLLSKPPKWSLLLQPIHVVKLFQIHKHYELIAQVKPTSVQQLADCIALIRPGKRELLQQYLISPENTRSLLYSKSANGYYFKRSHAISYALTIVLQLHLIEAGKL